MMFYGNKNKKMFDYFNIWAGASLLVVISLAFLYGFIKGNYLLLMGEGFSRDTSLAGGIDALLVVLAVFILIDKYQVPKKIMDKFCTPMRNE